MPQLSIYVNKEMRKKIERAAKIERCSVSSWARNKLARAIENTWPEGYFEIFGALADQDFERPPQGSFRDDTPRESL